MDIDMLIKKSAATLKYEGVGPFIKKTYSYTKRKISGVTFEVNNYKDILFINGCGLPHPARYRVDHQIEQLHFNGYSCDSVFYENLSIEQVKYYRAFIFFRCPHTEVVEEFINKAKYFNKKVFFDIDDLVIDEKYVKEIKYLKSMSEYEYNLYITGVNRMKRTLELCDYAITTTDRLSKELNHYVPEVFINRNVASEKMVEVSLKALEKMEGLDSKSEKIILGYFSGSITHNDNFNLILPIIKKIFEEKPNVYLKVVGILDIPTELETFKNRILTEKFMDWTKLPEVIASVDINIAPLEESIFNEAKSENKWVEASLVKVATIASNVGAFKDMITNGETGLLCNTTEEWEAALRLLVDNKSFRKIIASNAHKEVLDNCVTAYTGYELFDFIESRLNDNICFVLPSTQVSGGVNVVIKHCNILRNAGLDVLILSMGEEQTNIINNDGEINVISHHKSALHAYLRKCVASLWTTVSFVNTYSKIKEKYYLVQGFETNFSDFGNVMRIWSNLTYNSFSNMKYLTISKWCENWLKKKYKKEVFFARNGLDLSLFFPVEKDFTNKIIILIEGNGNNPNKNTDESFKITNKLDPNKYEIWYLSNDGKPKDWYRYDKFINKVPYVEVAEIYQKCHILLKSSKLESFSYPPLEMMATGGIAIVAPNEGNIEYLENNVNCLLYEPGNIEKAVEMITLVTTDDALRTRIIKEGIITAKSRSWTILEDEILNLYNVNRKNNNGESEFYETKKYQIAK
ncbi:glycosyltransferase [Paenibacillus sp. LHD-38]|uniref:glycosyltransferase n=1 Tax=Paenibacillus sp. LHD-38 TaxID=3072143 RepID=UPI00280F4942|nr:glycosyltransferase [Paenibacillus sp. LHD-38]MDQ8733036.1 glycosyltransferase [Paenibacillus sp. LHD-38]